LRLFRPKLPILCSSLEHQEAFVLLDADKLAALWPCGKMTLDNAGGDTALATDHSGECGRNKETADESHSEPQMTVTAENARLEHVVETSDRGRQLGI
jgi:hypothetical protein